MLSSSFFKSILGFRYIVLFFSVSCISASSATISIDSDFDSIIITLTTDAAANLAAIALDIDVAGAEVTAVTIDTANFNIYPDAAYSEELGDGYTYGEGTPVCAKLVPGEIALPQSSFCLCFANLNGEATAGADGAASVQVTITVSEPCQITICENEFRGGIVAVDGTALDAECIVWGDWWNPCQEIYNLTSKKGGGSDNIVNASDVGYLINYVGINKSGFLFVVTSLSPAYDPDYNLTQMLGGTDNIINVSDIGAIINFVNEYKTGSIFAVNCNTWTP